ncbi:MAG: MFS transporter [Alicyclobacillus sp. RIFOXYA1_FULL_53_8]|nr:MAG: MFS transporter [Alicyclobacillus sp. RIFOXYA1_FULL_53_8]
MHHATNRRNVTIAVMVATFLTAMDNTVVSTAMPTIVSELGGISLFSWVFAVYLLTTAVTTPIWGKLADLFGRKIIFTIGTALFLLGSMLSGMAQSMDQLIWFRAFQGIGAGAVFPITLTIIGDLYSYEERARIQGLFSAVWGISGIIGPLVGGFFVDYLSWRWIFYINVPVGLASMVLVWIFLNEQFAKQRKHIDYWGALTFAIGMTSLLYALLSGGQSYAWNSATIIGLFVIAVLTLSLFLWIQAHSPEPMLPLKLFTIRTISVANLAGFLAGAILIGLSAYLPMWIQGILGHSATNAGLTLTPMSIGWPIGATIGGRLMLKVGSRRISLIGMGAIFIASVWLATVATSTPQLVLIVIMLIVGFGFGFAMTAFTVVVQSVVGWNMRGAATASQQFVRTLGQTVGIAVFGTWFNRSITAYFQAHPGVHAISGQDMNKLLDPTFAKSLPSEVLHTMREGLASGLHSVFVIFALISIVGLLVIFWLPRYEPAPSNAEGEGSRA